MARRLDSNLMQSMEKIAVAPGYALEAASPRRDRLGQRFRERRMKHFLKLASSVPAPATLLDVGGTTDFWRGCIPDGFSLTLLNVFDQEPLNGVQILVGDGCDLARFNDKSIDLVFSNSVLCLVGGWEHQQQMASEIRRVGRRYFVQTANRDFPIDWRTLVPFFHWLPPSIQAWCFLRMPVGHYKKCRSPDQALELATRVRDLTRCELHDLFPEGTTMSERVFGFTKSFMVHHGFNALHKDRANGHTE